VPDGPLDLLYQVRENTYNGRRRIELNLKDFRPSGAETPNGLRASAGMA
jgi:hypothetical protein